MSEDYDDHLPVPFAPITRLWAIDYDDLPATPSVLELLPPRSPRERTTVLSQLAKAQAITRAEMLKNEHLDKCVPWPADAQTETVVEDAPTPAGSLRSFQLAAYEAFLGEAQKAGLIPKCDGEVSIAPRRMGKTFFAGGRIPSGTDAPNILGQEEITLDSEQVKCLSEKCDALAEGRAIDFKTVTVVPHLDLPELDGFSKHISEQLRRLAVDLGRRHDRECFRLMGLDFAPYEDSSRLKGDELSHFAVPEKMATETVRADKFNYIRSTRDATPWTHNREPWQAHRSKSKRKGKR